VSSRERLVEWVTTRDVGAATSRTTPQSLQASIPAPIIQRRVVEPRRWRVIFGARYMADEFRLPRHVMMIDHGYLSEVFRA
jgi:hypothetical protein